MLADYFDELITYHFNNLYGLNSDHKKHEQYYRIHLSDCDEEDLKWEYKKLMDKVGSWNSSDVGKMNAVTYLLNAKYPNWRNDGRDN